jgi:hypothetical protein
MSNKPTKEQAAELRKLMRRIRAPEPGYHPQFDCDLVAQDDSERIEAAKKLCDLVEQWIS